MLGCPSTTGAAGLGGPGSDGAATLTAISRLMASAVSALPPASSDCMVCFALAIETPPVSLFKLAVRARDNRELY